MTEPNDFNGRIISEFRANGGKVGAPFENAALLLLHSTGAKSGRERVSPLGYQAVNGGYAIFAAKAGAPGNPDWYHNLLANPQASVEPGAGPESAIPSPSARPTGPAFHAHLTEPLPGQSPRQRFSRRNEETTKRGARGRETGRTQGGTGAGLFTGPAAG